MADKRKPQGGSNTATSTTQLINIHFYENQKRQSLTTTEPLGTQGEHTPVPEHFSSVPTSCEDDNEEQNPPPVGAQPASSSSSAISAPSDKSRKGSVDKRIWNLVNLINGEKDSFFTTSSCSGRIILYTWEKGERGKKGCKWLLVSHDEVAEPEIVNAYMSSGTRDEGIGDIEDYVTFKMEPCILHIQCRTLSNARKLLHLATESGFRNSGMVIGKDNRITVAVRSAMGIEVPLPHPISHPEERYLNYLVRIGNEKMKENWTRTEKFCSLFSSTSWKDLN